MSGNGCTCHSAIAPACPLHGSMLGVHGANPTQLPGTVWVGTTQPTAGAIAAVLGAGTSAEDGQTGILAKSGVDGIADTCRQLDHVKLAIHEIMNAKQQAEEERDAARSDFAALDHVVQHACRAAGVEKIEHLLRAINTLRNERNEARRKTVELADTMTTMTAIVRKHVAMQQRLVDERAVELLEGLEAARKAAIVEAGS